ncbi:galactose-1-phosphate uridylyltransferase [Arthrospira platensis]|jgi:UDPglucose--hexose-1-phosphate uridylyltransferase|uniref:Galactose-1-phosphate uridylyltransferase n=1 Tax=Limnospira platensis NIES-46 TaxID=1236695 RepID=A0A5M3T8W3_LIMPL|nr:galactose-1-phosphate uridylyltransferase [Arthrospira platensis]AMW31298.1 galactose-1-phosphate uridylyltransferase [Arthrospira platensis YZ]MBD2667906.1 galactose-1-phosphate uridylyltransferase [Arthrospira platensis FACHB-439]MBD2708956.1 galactose-1-phosphate uridylyltransferase [Arthrospira platensis FACHB-835]MDF2208762.1 galactose-1-phosphate uridylyltransferase [Arthrospira platensis NCB002]MDT9293789.1 galactose-1-phosphate uridylyltransferase [Arthrospira platensis PCC 7345]BA
MTELRQNLVTRDWVIIASERAKRPHEFAPPLSKLEPLPTYRDDCPFCPGNEHLTGTKECLRLADNGGWRVRVVGNKYPALSDVGQRVRHGEGIFKSLSGVGYHEVVIEHPRHDLNIALMDIQDISNILRVYRQRYSELRQDARVETIIIFKNHGGSAGTSLEHPHSQIAALPIVPYQWRDRAREAVRYYDDTGECLFCRTLKDELKAGDRIIYAGEHFVAFIPYAALSPFHTWIFPRNHASSFDEITDLEIPDLAQTLKVVMSQFYFGLNNPDFNYTIRSIPTAEQRTDYFHWYIAIIPRVSLTAGFELGSGMYINTSVPEESAEFLRSIKIPSSI